MRYKSLMFTLLILILAGCTTRMADLTIISTKNIGDLSLEDYEKIRASAKGENRARFIFGFIPIDATFTPNIEEAIDIILEKYKGDYLTNAVLYRKFIWIPWIYMESSYIVKGDVWGKESDK